MADVILRPIPKYEEQDIGADQGISLVFFDEKKCVEPIGESKSDYEIVCLIAKNMNFWKIYRRQDG
jgi:nitrate reductase alpha subunit